MSERKFQQSAGCALNFYLSIRVSTIRDAVIIFHAPVGCSSPALGYRELFRNIPASDGRSKFDLHWLTTGISEKDVVFGGSEKLRKAIKMAERRYNPKAIFILTSCTSGIIGEDLEGTASEMQPHIKAKIVPIHCEGIRSRLVQTGYDAFWHGVLKYLVKKPEKKQKDLVNVASMLSYTWQDRVEMTRLLGKMGLRPNFVPEFASVQQLEEMSEAAVTAPLCPTYTDYISRGLEQEYGVPFFMYPSPVGFQGTDEWLRKIAEYTGKEGVVENVIEEEHRKWGPRLKAIRKEFENFKGNGQKIEMLGALGQGRLLTQLPYFDELGIKSSAALSQDYDNLILEDLEKVVDQVGDFKILVNTFQASEQAHITRMLNPDITLTCPFQGSAYKRNKGATRTHAVRCDNLKWSQQTAYAGAVAYGNFLLQGMKSESWQKTMLEKTQFGYKDWFFKQPDPLYYLEKDA
jgi:nitrogenase molybdenum-iron protein alpha chain